MKIHYNARGKNLSKIQILSELILNLYLTIHLSIAGLN